MDYFFLLWIVIAEMSFSNVKWSFLKYLHIFFFFFTLLNSKVLVKNSKSLKVFHNLCLRYDFFYLFVVNKGHFFCQSKWKIYSGYLPSDQKLQHLLICQARADFWNVRSLVVLKDINYVYKCVSVKSHVKIVWRNIQLMIQLSLGVDLLVISIFFFF